MARKSSTFYRLERNIGDGYKQVYEFHTVVNGNVYIAEHEERPDGSTGYIGKNRRCTKEAGNREYLSLKAAGYKFTGIYEMDILGHKTLLKEAN